VHSTRMLTKLELANRAQAAILAHEAGLYDWSDSLWGLGCQGRVSAGRPLPRQGCCASLRDGLRPPLTREPRPALGQALSAGQGPCPMGARSPSPLLRVDRVVVTRAGSAVGKVDSFVVVAFQVFV